MTALEKLPDTWDSERDERFFRITARLLPARVVDAGSSLLASYDEDDLLAAPAVRQAATRAHGAQPRRATCASPAR